ncbi:hypothetical protein QT969_25760 [Rhodococcus sp. CSLK01-03]|uniref:Uncharacterized protein n=1 Tax=Rhodococcus indonesiensis TaxID=3055869 RepID=A0ABT7RVL5_9NOCA|nr:hypothetical protein [Rhodococcus indonesiensis]MDM7491689.1 hypothetical protein [Rhodococcus indonesiensis]
MSVDERVNLRTVNRLATRELRTIPTLTECSCDRPHRDPLALALCAYPGAVATSQTVGEWIFASHCGDRTKITALKTLREAGRVFDGANAFGCDAQQCRGWHVLRVVAQ